MKPVLNRNLLMIEKKDISCHNMLNFSKFVIHILKMTVASKYGDDNIHRFQDFLPYIFLHL